MKRIIIILLFIISMKAFADDATVSHSIEVLFTVEWTKGTSKVDLIIAMPKSIEGRQTVHSIEYIDGKPYQIIERDESSYAHYIVNTDTELPGSKKIKYLITFETSPFQKAIASIDSDVLACLGPTEYFDTTIKQARHLAREIPYDDPLRMSLAIADVVKENIAYAPIQRSIGIKEALETKKGDCTEYADVFITIARLKNIPARFVNGYYIVGSSMQPHDWVEVFTTKYGWVCVDLLFEGADIFRSWDNRLILTYERYDSVLRGCHNYYFFTTVNRPGFAGVLVM